MLDVIWYLWKVGVKVCMVIGDNLSVVGLFGLKSGILLLILEWLFKEFFFYGCDSKVLKNVCKIVNVLRILFS